MSWVHVGNSEIDVDIIDYSFYSTLKRVLLNWFGIDILELPRILSLMGVESGVYQLKKDAMDTTVVSAFISTDDERKYTLQLFRGDMVNPYPTWVLIEEDTQLRKCFIVEMKPSVEELSVELLCATDSNGKFVD